MFAFCRQVQAQVDEIRCAGFQASCRDGNAAVSPYVAGAHDMLAGHIACAECCTSFADCLLV